MRSILYFTLLILVSNLTNAQWKEIPGLYLESEYVGMDVDEIIADGNLLYAIIQNDIYLSYNSGNSWMNASGYNYTYPNCITSIDSNLYVGTLDKGVTFSNNFGVSYKEINQNLPENPKVRNIHTTDSVIVAAIYSDNPVRVRDTYYSFDQGVNWSVSNGLTDEYIECFASDGTKLYAGTYSGVYQSIDNGRNWTNIGLNNKRIHTIAAKGNKIFAGYSNSQGNLFISTDNGINWDPLEGNGLTTTWFYSIVLKDEYLIIASGWDGIFRSNNDGVSWTKTTSGINALPVKVLALYKDQLFAGTFDGIAISNNNGSSWKQKINTYNLKVRDIGLSGKNILATTNHGVNLTKNQGISWDRILINMQIIECLDSIVYVGSDKGFYHSSDYGESLSWYDVRGLPDDPMITDFYAIDTIVFGSLYGHGIYYSDNLGVNWSERNNGLIKRNIIGLTLIDSMIFAATDTNGIYHSDKLGLNWDSVCVGLEEQNLTCLTNYGNFLYAGTKDSGFFKSSDYGISWSQTPIESSNTVVNCLYPYGKNIFAGTKEKGLFLSTNNGENWVSYNQGLLDYNINSIDGNDSIIYIGSKGGAIWARSINEFPLSLSVKEIKASKKAICEGDTIQLTAQAIGGTPPYTYIWSDNKIGNIIHVSPSETTSYQLKVTDANLDTASFDITIWVKQKPDKPTLLLDGDTLISSSEIGNIWFYESALISNVISNKYISELEGSYSIKVLKNGCLSDESDQILYSHSSNNFTNNCKIYPNPANDKLIIQILLKTDENIIQIINIIGQVVLDQIIRDVESVIDISYLDSGIYFVTLKNSEYSLIKKIVVE